MQNDYGQWLSGFIDAEGSFSVSPDKKTYRCGFALTQRADDVQTLRTIQKFTGIGNVTVHNRSDKSRHPEATWQMGSKEHCARLCKILERFPLRAKKSRDFIIWRDALQESFRVNPNPGKGAGFDWTNMANFSSNLRHTRAFNPDIRLPCSPDEGFLGWLGGFIDGEGSFMIQRNGPSFTCNFGLRVRADDRSIMEEIVDRTKIGYLYDVPASHGSNPRIHWFVNGKKNIAKLRDLIDNHMCLFSRKKWDYDLWYDAVEYWLTCPGKRPKRGEEFDWTPLAEMRLTLKELRRFNYIA